jgi:hypothetical protein
LDDEPRVRVAGPAGPDTTRRVEPAEFVLTRATVGEALLSVGFVIVIDDPNVNVAADKTKVLVGLCVRVS